MPRKKANAETITEETKITTTATSDTVADVASVAETSTTDEMVEKTEVKTSKRKSKAKKTAETKSEELNFDDSADDIEADVEVEEVGEVEEEKLSSDEEFEKELEENFAKEFLEEQESKNVSLGRQSVRTVKTSQHFTNEDGSIKKKSELTKEEEFVEAAIHSNIPLMGTLSKVTISDKCGVKEVSAVATVFINGLSFEVTIPFSDMGFTESSMLPKVYKNMKRLYPEEHRENGKFLTVPATTLAARRLQKKLLDKCIGAKIDFVVKIIDNNVAFGSRREAMLSNRRRYFFKTAQKAAPSIQVGSLVDANVLMVTMSRVFIEYGGYVTSVTASNLTTCAYSSLYEIACPGQTIQMKITNISNAEEASSGDFSINSDKLVVNMRSASLDKERKEAAQKVARYRISDNALGTIVKVNENGSYVARLSDGTTCFVSQYSTFNHSPISINDVVSLFITGKEAKGDYPKTFGTIKYVLSKIS